MGRNYLAENSQLSAMFIETLGDEDTRRPRMDMGLGIFTAETRRYYPMEDIREAGAIIDELDGQGILVFIDTQSMTPAAMFVEAESATVAEREVHLDTGEVVRSGVLYDSKGVRIDAERPQQLFTRWYGYALTFPGAEIYGQ
jgi:hypothetical protein